MEEQEYALTCGQRWLLHVALHAKALAKAVQRVYRLPPAADNAALLAAFGHVVATREALRLQLVETEHGWRQRFPRREAHIAGTAIRGSSAAHREAHARGLLRADADHVFDLTREAPYRAKLLAFDDQLWLSLSIDHLAADELGFDQLEHELELAYRQEAGLNAGAPPAAQPGAFIDYIAREAAGRADEAPNLAFWIERLFEPPPAARPSRGDGWVESRAARWHLGGAPFDRLGRACRARGCSLFAAVLAAQAALLAELGAGADLVLNVPVSNRATHAERSIVGNLSMLLHVRIRVHPSDPPAAHLRRVRDLLVDALIHRQYDYPALSDAVAARAPQPGWRLGCNYTIDRPALDHSAPPVLARVDPFAGETFATPSGAFTLTCRQHPLGLGLRAEWDPTVWRVSASELSARYDAILASFAQSELRAAQAP